MSDDEVHVIKKLKEYWLDTMVCTHCGFCKSVCPGFQVTRTDTRSPRAKVMLAYGLLKGDFEPDESVRDVLYICSTCMDCARRCPSSVKTLDILMAARRELAKKGLVPEGELMAIENIEKFNNPSGEPKEKRTEFYPDEALARVGKGAEILVFMGCTTSYADMKMAKNVFKILENAKVDYTLLGQDEPCCGMMNYLAGFEVGEFGEVIKKKIEALDPKPKLIITPCPGCFRSLGANYKEFGVDIGVEVKHTLDFFINLMESGKLKVKKPLKGKAFYHDPCDLGRHTGIYDEPRKLLAYFTEVHEFEHNREEAHCCGGGGGLQAAAYDVAAEIAKRRLREALDQGAEIVVTSCPACKANFSAVLSDLKKETGKKLKVMDLTDIVGKYTEAG
jgi:glycolate oxidase